MNERRRNTTDPNPEPIDESTYGGSAAETGGMYQGDGAAAANEAGDTMSLRDDGTDAGPEDHADG